MSGYWSVGLIGLLISGATPAEGNRAERVERFQDLGLGMFIHWSMDSQIGTVISHSMVGASEDYVNRYIHDLPKTFNPTKFEPEEWARLAKLAGMRYVVFTTKHHSGFCMFDTRTTDFNIMNTPYGKDITREIVDAFRHEGLSVGFYFSPDDFWFLHKQGHMISRSTPECSPVNNPELMAHNKAQLRELLTNYGPIEFLFLDGEPSGLKELAWELQPDLVVTRGAMETPEQRLPDAPLPGPWEACFTMGTSWQFQPTNDPHKSGTEIIEMFIETRAKGGNLLLNVGPEPSGVIPQEQERLLRELALWNFVNGESVFSTRPWHVTRERGLWFTRAKDADTVYIHVTGRPWPYGERKVVTVRSVKATEETTVEILGQSGETIEYRPEVKPKATWRQDDEGLHITAMHAQRLYDDHNWPNPMVIKVTHVARTP